MHRSHLSIPPKYANIRSQPIYDPDLSDPLFRTYSRVTGLAWERDYEETPPLTIQELCVVCHMQERGLWGHLRELRRRGLLTWHTDEAGRLVLRLVRLPESSSASTGGRDYSRRPSGAKEAANLAVLAEFDVDAGERAAWEVAGLPHVTPDLVRAWGMQIRRRTGVHNVPGLLLHVLRTTNTPPPQGKDPRGGWHPKSGQEPVPPAVQPSMLLPCSDSIEADSDNSRPADQLLSPEEYDPIEDDLRQALERLGLAGDSAWSEVTQTARRDSDFVWAWVEYVERHRDELTRPAGLLRSSLRGTTWPPDEPDAEQRQREKYRVGTCSDGDEPIELPPSPREEKMARYGIDAETMSVWERVQPEIALQMTAGTFNTYLRDALLLSVSDGQAVIGVQSRHALAWLEGRLGIVVQRTLGWFLENPDVSLSFTLLENVEDRGLSR